MMLLWLDAGMLMVGFVVFCCRDAASEVDGLMVVCLFSIDLHGRLIAMFPFLSGVVGTSHSPSIRQRHLMLCRMPVSVALAIRGDGKKRIWKKFVFERCPHHQNGRKKTCKGTLYAKNHSPKP